MAEKAVAVSMVVLELIAVVPALEVQDAELLLSFFELRQPHHQ